jgi:hypothetical protein
MKRVGFAMFFGAALGLAGVAQADCAADLPAAQAKLPQIKDPKRREEARLLIEKAALDQQHGRPSLCEAALKSASKLMN